MDFEKLFDEYYDKIYVYIVRRVKDTATAEDLTSEVFLKVFVNPYNPAIAKFSTYIFTIASNLLKNYYRAAPKRDVVDITDVTLTDNTDILGDVITGEENAALLDALKKLPLNQYEVVYRRYYLEQNFREIGTAIGVSDANARKLHERALKKLSSQYLGGRVYMFESGDKSECR